jgi:septal ring factor EnvC (AmiA/AmiB activator)
MVLSMTPPDDGGALAMRPMREPALRFFLDEPLPGAVASRLASARTALREAEQAEWQERQRIARAGRDGRLPDPPSLLQVRQAQCQVAQAAVDELRRRIAGLRQAIALGEEAIAAQRALVDRLRRELSEICE